MKIVSGGRLGAEVGLRGKAKYRSSRKAIQSIKAQKVGLIVDAGAETEISRRKLEKDPTRQHFVTVQYLFSMRILRWIDFLRSGTRNVKAKPQMAWRPSDHI